jgi:hypothetical protein
MHRVYGKHRLGACVGSILEIEPGQSPTFEKVEPGDLPAAVSEFVRPYGLAYIELALDPNPTADQWGAFATLGYSIFRGPSLRRTGTSPDEYDAVVLLGNKLAHDPGSDGSPFAVDELNVIFDGTATIGWRLGLFVPYDPLRVRRHARPT